MHKRDLQHKEIKQFKRVVNRTRTIERAHVCVLMECVCKNYLLNFLRSLYLQVDCSCFSSYYMSFFHSIKQ